MTERVHKQKQRRAETKDEVEDQRTADKKKSAEELKAELDDLLDEVDECLEENAAEFVAEYRQKGGQ